MPEDKKVIQNLLKVVIIDDNFVVRDILKTFLTKFKIDNNLDYKIYTSEDGVSGLGYIYVIKPEIIVIDTTLPKYSGREVIDYILSNPNLNSDNTNFIILHDGAIESLRVPGNAAILDKKNPDFINNFLKLFSKIIISRRQAKSQLNLNDSFKISLGEQALKWAGRSERTRDNLAKNKSPLRVFTFLKWTLSEIMTSLFLSLIRIFNPKVEDDNIDQKNKDIRSYRARHYPTLVAFLVTVIFFVFQLGVYLSSTLAIFKLTNINQPVIADVFPNGYSYRRTITIDHTKVSGGAALTNFPILVSGTYSYLATTGNGGNVTNANGYDIIFTSDPNGSTKLDHEVERYDPATGQISSWIEIPSLSNSSDTIIYMFYGNSSISTSQESINNTWNTNYKAVWHLDESPADSAPEFKDSTVTSNDGSAKANLTGGASVAGKIGNSINIPGTTDTAIDLETNDTYDSYTEGVISAWINVTSNASDGAIITGGPSGNFFVFGVKTTNKLSIFSQCGLNVETTNAISNYLGNWHHVAYRNTSADTYTFFVDGVAVDSGSGGIFFSDCGIGQTSDYDIGDVPGNISIFNGKIDELRVMNSAVSDGWIITNYTNENDPATFYAISSEELPTSTTITVSSNGTHTSTLSIGTVNQYSGGSFVITTSTATAAITSIKINETGTLNAQTGLDNIKLFYELDSVAPYDCASESYAGSETQYGSTDTDGFDAANGFSTFTGNVILDTNQAMCIYIVTDITTSVNDSETLKFEISNPTTDITVSAGTITPATVVGISGNSTLRETTLTASAYGSQLSTVTFPITSKYLGGAFVLTPSTADATITGITITENDTIDAQNHLKNIKLFYDLDSSAPYNCVSESFTGGESQFGSTDTDGFSGANGTSSFTGNVQVTTSQAMCVYVVVDVPYNANAGDKINITINNPTTDITITAGDLQPATSIDINSFSTLQGCQTFSNGYCYRRSFVVDHTKVSGSSAIPSFVVLISGTYSFLATEANGGRLKNANGYDITFSTLASGGNILGYEVEEYDPVTGKFIAWVRINTLQYNQDTTFYMFYGNSSVTTSQENSNSVWNLSYLGVYHMKETPTINSDEPNSLLTSNTSLTFNAGMSAGNQVAGVIDGSIEFDGASSTDSMTQGGVNQSLQTTTQLTLEAWIKRKETGEGVVLVRGGAGLSKNYAIYLSNGGEEVEFRYATYANGESTYRTNTGLLNINEWIHVVVTHEFGNAVSTKVYINGVLTTGSWVSGSGGNAAVSENLSLTLGSLESNHATAGIDELRISNTVKGANYIQTIYNNQSSPSTFYSVLPEVTPSMLPAVNLSTNGSQTGYFYIPVYFPTNNKHIGGSIVVQPTESATNLTSITLFENGSVDAQNGLKNIKLFYDTDTSVPYNCASESYSGTETQFGSTVTNGFDGANGYASFSGSVGLDTNKAICFYVVLDVVSGAGDNTTIEIEINNPTDSITLSQGGVSNTSAVQIPGATNLYVPECASFESGYCFRRTVTIDHTKVAGGVDLTDFPILVGGTHTYLRTEANGGKVKNTNGYDIIFATDNQGVNKLDHEVERYIASTGEILMWVRIPNLSVSADTIIYMFYGNQTITTSEENKTGVWDSNYVGVWHMNQTPSPGGLLLDSTVNANHVTFNSAMSSGDLITGTIGNGIDFDGTVNDSIISENQTSLQTPTNVSIEAWMKKTNDTDGFIMIRDVGSTINYGLKITGTSEIRFNYSTIAQGESRYTTSGNGFPQNNWYFISFSNTFGTPSSAAFYLNGQSKSGSWSGSANYLPTLDNGAGISFGSAQSNPAQVQLDEVRVSKSIRSQGWMQTDYNNQSSPTTFITIGNEDNNNTAPSISSLILNNGANISLVENSTIPVQWTATVTDNNGYTDIKSIEGKLYRSGVAGGKDCTANNNNCYAVASCSVSNCSGNSCQATCTANVYFFADPTDTGVPFESQTWQSWMKVTDVTNSTNEDFSAADTTELLSLRGVTVAGSINYGQFRPGTNSGSTNQITKISNTGNVPIDIELNGSRLCLNFPTCTGTFIDVNNQQYSFTNFVFGNGTALSLTPQKLNVSLSKPTASPSNSFVNLYWGINLPGQITTGTYQGQSLIIAVPDE